MSNIEYCEYKLLLKGDRFSVSDDFRRFWRKVRKLAEACDVDVHADPDALAFLTRRVHFYDTPSFDLYQNAFILRKRVRIENGFDSEHEVTLKFRHPDLQTARSVEMRVDLGCDARIKFKEEILQPSDGSCGFRSIFSHNHVQRAGELKVGSDFATVSASFPALAVLEVPRGTPITLVNGKVVEEVGADTGRLCFGGGYEAKSSLALWRDCSHESRFIGEFSFQARVRDDNVIAAIAKDRSLHFFSRLQSDLHDWLAVGSTKTALIYGGAVGHD